MPHARVRGLSLIESLVGTAILATTAASVAPGLAQWRGQLGLQQAAATFETDVQHARALATARQETLRLAFEETPEGSCYVLHSGPRGACRCTPDAQAQCTGDARAWRVEGLPASQPVRLASNVRSMAFDPVHGTASPAATVRFTAAGGKAVHQVVGILGRVRACTPGGELPGYKAC